MKRFFSTTRWCNYIKKTNDHLHLRPWREPPFVIEVVERTKDPSLAFYKWKFQPLPTQTVLDKVNPQFSIRSPEFKLPTKHGRISRKQWRRQMADLQTARNNVELEKLSRSRKLFIDVDHVNNEWKKEYGISDVNKLAHFYGINRDICNDQDVIWNTWLNIAFDDATIHRGNLVEPKKLSSKPTTINYEGDEDCLYSLIMTNLDGHPLSRDKEILHWFLCNIRNSDVNKSDTVAEYIPPMPWKGSGFHRVAFTLYKQEESLSLSTSLNNNSISGRTFDSFSFAKQQNLSPVGVTWCQLEWDESVSQTSSYIQDLQGEPVFDWEEYIEPKTEERILKRQLSELRFRNM